MIGGDLKGLRSLAAAACRKLTPFHGADEADADAQGSVRNGVHSCQLAVQPVRTGALPLVYPCQKRALSHVCLI
jgi:hypothetical protein